MKHFFFDNLWGDKRRRVWGGIRQTLRVVGMGALLGSFSSMELWGSSFVLNQAPQTPEAHQMRMEIIRELRAFARRHQGAGQCPEAGGRPLTTPGFSKATLLLNRPPQTAEAHQERTRMIAALRQGRQQTRHVPQEQGEDWVHQGGGSLQTSEMRDRPDAVERRGQEAGPTVTQDPPSLLPPSGGPTQRVHGPLQRVEAQSPSVTSPIPPLVTSQARETLRETLTPANTETAPLPQPEQTKTIPDPVLQESAGRPSPVRAKAEVREGFDILSMGQKPIQSASLDPDLLTSKVHALSQSSSDAQAVLTPENPSSEGMVTVLPPTPTQEPERGHGKDLFTPRSQTDAHKTDDSSDLEGSFVIVSRTDENFVSVDKEESHSEPFEMTSALNSDAESDDDGMSMRAARTFSVESIDSSSSSVQVLSDWESEKFVTDKSSVSAPSTETASDTGADKGSDPSASAPSASDSGVGGAAGATPEPAASAPPAGGTPASEKPPA